mgnify:FL=1
MRLKLSIFVAVLLALTGFYFPQEGHAQTVTLKPSAIPNGVQSASGQQYRQRFDITLGGSATTTFSTVGGPFLTITPPPEVTIVAASFTGTTNNTTTSLSTLSLATNVLTVAVTSTTVGEGQSIGNTKITLEFDVTTPTSFAGVGSGAKVDTSYTFNFGSGSNQTDRSVSVAKHNDLPVRFVSFAAPDSSQGDTTTAGGRFFKLKFASSGLPDLSHQSLSGLTADPSGIADGTTDIVYSFYLSTDSALVKRPSGLAPAGFFTLQPTRTDRKSVV